jgi:NAD-dependent oxidoreductase involved in siderophore biosynthesis
MIDLFAPIQEAARITVKPEHKLPTAIVGAGEIVDLAHLPAYREHGLDIVGITDINEDRAKEVAERHGIPRVYKSHQEIAADKDVAVVDIAVYPWVQHEIAIPMLDAGKDLLCQKPSRTTMIRRWKSCSMPKNADGSWRSTSRCASPRASPQPGP